MAVTIVDCELAIFEEPDVKNSCEEKEIKTTRERWGILVSLEARGTKRQQ